MPSLFSSLVALSLSTLAAAQGTISLAPPSAVPSGASNIISSSFAGFGIEPSNLFSFTGGEQANELTINLLQNLADYTGTPPHLRIGGNTQDNLIYEANYTDWDRQVNPYSVAPNGAFKPDQYVFGPRFFQALNRLPQGTPITFGLNLAYEQPDYLTRIVESATAAKDGLNNLNLVSFEIGNEPDLYLQNGFRSGAWDGSVYTQEWLTRATAVWQQVLQGHTGSRFFEPGATASTIGTSFEIMDLVQDGITAKANGSTQNYVAGFNQHDYYYYIGVSTYTLTFQGFTDLSTLTNQFSAWTTQLSQAQAAGFPYFLREMGVVGPIGMAGITDTFAASLWTLNFFCYAATIGIASVQMHMTDNSNASAWQPIPYPPYSPQPFVRPNYYAWAAMTQVIGKGCSTQIAKLDVTGQPGQYDNRIVAYTSYQQGTLAAIILINSVIANVSDTSKNSLTIDLSLPDFAGKMLYLSYLTADGADAKHGATWNGTSFEKSGSGKPTVVDSTANTVTIGSDGSATVTLRDSQAVVANIGSFVGTSGGNKTACAALADSSPDAQKSGAAGSAATSTSSSSSSSSSSTHSSTASTTSARPTSGSVAWSMALLTVLVTVVVNVVLTSYS